MSCSVDAPEFDARTKTSRLAGLAPFLSVSFPVSSAVDAYSQQDVNRLIEFLVHATARDSSYTPEEVLRAAEHVSPSICDPLELGYERQAVDAFVQLLITVLRTL